MHAHRYCRTARARLFGLIMLLPALLARGAAATPIQSFPDNIPDVNGGWYTDWSSLAVGGDFYTTFNSQYAVSSVAVWAVNLPQDGQYQVYISSVPTYGVRRTYHARYEITTAQGTQVVGGVDQNFSGERLLGTFPMSVGLNQLRLTDVTGEPPYSHTLVANAARWVLTSDAVPPPPITSGSGITGYLDFYGNPINAAPPGSPVIITGGDFDTSGTVAFNGVKAPIVRWTRTAVRVLTPLGTGPTTGPVTVTTPDGTFSGPPFTISDAAPPLTPQPSPPPVPLTPPVPFLPPLLPAPVSDWPVFMHDPRQLGLADGALDPRGLSPWSFSLGSRPGCSPVLLGGVAYIGTEAGVVAIDTASHSQRWFRPLPAAARSAPAAGPQVVVVSAGGLYGLSTADGSILWQRPDIVANDDVSPMLVNDTVYIGARGPGGFVMAAVSATTGTNVWPAPVPLPAGFDNRATAAASPDLGLLFVSLGPPAASLRPGVGPSAVVALRLSDGVSAWPAPAVFPANPPAMGLSVGWVSSVGYLAVIQPAVFVAAGGSVTALNATSGATLWTRTLPEASLLGPPVISSAAQQGSTLYVGAASGRVYALDSTTGATAPGGLTTALAPITGTMALAGNYLYVPTASGLVAADVTTGTVFWTNPPGAASGVAVAGGIPYVATADGQFVGFGAAPPLFLLPPL